MKKYIMKNSDEKICPEMSYREGTVVCIEDACAKYFQCKHAEYRALWDMGGKEADKLANAIKMDIRNAVTKNETDN